MEYVLTANALNKTYRHFKALDGLSMHIPAQIKILQNPGGGWAQLWKRHPFTLI